MDKQKLISSKPVYDSFRNELENKINNRNISINNNQCYLMDDNWIEEYIKSFNNINKPRSRYKRGSKFNSFKPDVLNDFSSIINYLKEGRKFKIINKEFMEFIFNENELNQNNLINYYTGNNKIIIEYVNENNALLILNPNDNKNNKNIYIINKSNNNEENEKLYEKILKKFKAYLINNKEYKDIIKTFDDFINNKNTKSLNKQNDNDIIQEKYKNSQNNCSQPTSTIYSKEEKQITNNDKSRNKNSSNYYSKKDSSIKSKKEMENDNVNKITIISIEETIQTEEKNEIDNI